MEYDVVLSVRAQTHFRKHKYLMVYTLDGNRAYVEGEALRKWNDFFQTGILHQPDPAVRPDEFMIEPPPFLQRSRNAPQAHPATPEFSSQLPAWSFQPSSADGIFPHLPVESAPPHTARSIPTLYGAPWEYIHTASFPDPPVFQCKGPSCRSDIPASAPMRPDVPS